VTAVSILSLAQVRVTVPSSHFKSHERIVAKVENVGKRAVSFCVEFGQSSVRADSGAGEIETETTPIPFYVERRACHRWSVLLIGPDVGSTRFPVVLDPGKAYEFPFRLSAKEEIRLVLDYWVGETESCHDSKGKRTTRSAVFLIQ